MLPLHWTDQIGKYSPKQSSTQVNQDKGEEEENEEKEDREVDDNN